MNSGSGFEPLHSDGDSNSPDSGGKIGETGKMDSGDGFKDLHSDDDSKPSSSSNNPTTGATDGWEDVATFEASGTQDDAETRDTESTQKLDDSRNRVVTISDDSDDNKSDGGLQSDDNSDETPPRNDTGSEDESYDYSSHREEKGPHWKGTSIEELKLESLPDLLPLTPCVLHTILVKVPLKDGMPQPFHPFNKDSEDKWDGSHVKMPFSSHNTYSDYGYTKKMWDKIESALKDLKNKCVSAKRSYPADPMDVQDAILKYNKQKCNLSGLSAFLFSWKNKETFFKTTLPAMIDLALELPKICKKAIPMLKQQKAHILTLSQHQIASLLANAFFCTFPGRNDYRRWDKAILPDINFNGLFQGSSRKGGFEPKKAEKLKCLLHYFGEVTRRRKNNELTGMVSFKRHLIKEFPTWRESKQPISRLHVTSKGTIEDDGEGMLQVDFANKYVGGGVLGNGCVQEEIRFVICPEMLVSRLFTEVLEKNECLVMTGCERYCSYKGYASSFKFAGECMMPHEQKRDQWGRANTEVVAIDAVNFRYPEEQYKDHHLIRELHKAYVGFQYVPVTKNVSVTSGTQSQHPAVATGNWGCGAFGGDVQLKALIQMIAASHAERNVCYFTFNDRKLRDQLDDVHTFITDNKLDVADLWNLVSEYCRKRCRREIRRQDIFTYIKESPHQSDNTDCDTDSTVENNSPSQSDDYAAHTP